MEIGNITKAASFKSFLHLSLKEAHLLFFVTYADLKISLYARLHTKRVPWKFRNLKPKEFSSSLPVKFEFS